MDGHDNSSVSGDRQGPVSDARRFDAQDKLGIEAYATYLPIHFFPEGHWKAKRSGWGIYISEAGVKRVAMIIDRDCLSIAVPPARMRMRPSCASPSRCSSVMR